MLATEAVKLNSLFDSGSIRGAGRCGANRDGCFIGCIVHVLCSCGCCPDLKEILPHAETIRKLFLPHKERIV
ncbi:MAG TPA: hypothetical protein VE732_01470 [Nitrososphaera sp.]|nr:hypothetical protein [Nitrososphaera sp.]